MSASTLRKAGLCGDHFFPESFWNNTKNRLKSNQNPIPYWNASAEEDETEKRMQEEVKKRIKQKIEKRIQEEIQEIIEEEKGETDKEEDETANRETGTGKDASGIISEISDSENEIPVKRAKVVKTYPGAAKKDKFITLDEENDQMEWSKIEPPLPSTSSSDIQGTGTLSAEERVENIKKGLTKKFKKLKKDDESVRRKMARKIQSLQ